jgi:acyl carrier protein phosphodiesterase
LNFLAHIYLSGNNEKLAIGNFIGDFVKGSNYDGMDEMVVNGIVLHRTIDQFTDSHEIVKSSKKRLQAKYRHYSPVIVDVFYDHFLATNWEKYSPTPLLAFTNKFYEIIQSHHALLPEKAAHMFKYMQSGNWLYNYRLTEGINQALTGMSRRTKFDSKMDEATQDLLLNYSSFEQEFTEFFPLLQAHCEALILNLSSQKTSH